MKRVLPITAFIIVAAIVFSSCSNSSAGATTDQALRVDTVGLAQFFAWKKQKEFAEQYALYTANRAANTVTAKPAPAVRREKKGTLSTTTSYPAKAPAKKGWSKAAKGATIGAASGAVLGAVIAKKNRALGAVIGGVAGGGIGYGIGRHLDKKAGR